MSNSQQNDRPTLLDDPSSEPRRRRLDLAAATKRFQSVDTAQDKDHGFDSPSSREIAVLYRWIRLPKHCALTGDTPYSVHARRRKGVWQDGVQCQLGPDGNLYVNPVEWNKWVEGSSTPSSVRAA